MQNSKLKFGLAFATASLILSACGGGPDTTPQPVPQPTEQTGTIYGQVSPASAITNTVRPLSQIVKGPEFVAQVNAQGQFNLPLPSAATIEGKYSADLIPFKDYFGLCNSITTAPNDFKVLTLNALTNDKNTGLEVSSNGGTTFTYWWFVNKSGTVKVVGDNCIVLGNINQTFDFKRGWNMVKVTTNGKTSSYTVSAPTTERLKWTPQGITGQSLKPNFHTPWMNLEQYKNRQ